MEAYTQHPRSIYAGVKLMARNYGGRMQLTRVGDELRVISHNAYVLVERTVPADFADWEDGKSICFDLTQTAANGIAAITKFSSDASITFEPCPAIPTKGYLAVSAAEYVDHRVDVEVRIAPSLVTENRWLDEGIVGEPCDELNVSDKVLRDAARAVNQVSTLHFDMVEWKLKIHGAEKPIELTCEEKKARVLFMPCRSRLESGANE